MEAPQTNRYRDYKRRIDRTGHNGHNVNSARAQTAHIAHKSTFYRQTNFRTGLGIPAI